MTFDTRNPALGRYAEPRNTLLQGLEGDFEFTFGDVSADQDTIQLIGAYSRNKMMLVRLKEDAESYINKVKDIRNAVYGKALATTTIGGQEVKMSVFGLIRSRSRSALLSLASSLSTSLQKGSRSLVLMI